MEAYRNLKAERPQYMVGVRVDDYLLFMERMRKRLRRC